MFGRWKMVRRSDEVVAEDDPLNTSPPLLSSHYPPPFSLYIRSTFIWSGIDVAPFLGDEFYGFINGRENHPYLWHVECKLLIIIQYMLVWNNKLLKINNIQTKKKIRPHQWDHI